MGPSGKPLYEIALIIFALQVRKLRVQSSNDSPRAYRVSSSQKGREKKNEKIKVYM